MFTDFLEITQLQISLVLMYAEDFKYFKARVFAVNSV